MSTSCSDVHDTNGSYIKLQDPVPGSSAVCLERVADVKRTIQILNPLETDNCYDNFIIVICL